MKFRLISHGLLIALLSAAAARGWDPDNGDWSKSDPADVRIMTWNILDGIRTENPKTEGLNNWTALARIVASMQPDVLIIQEAGDNGCGGCVDTTAELETVLDLFFHGGGDPFLGGTVTAYVQKYAPAYDLTHYVASGGNDGYNRNALASRWPPADLNGDTKSEYSDIPFMLPDQYAPGGHGGIRGFQFVEIDLPDGTYAGDLVMGNAHLKSGGSSSDLADRLEAAQNVAYVVDYWYNGAGTGIPDPNGKIIDTPAATSILDSLTPVVMGGDWNEDEQTNGRRGPAEWLTQAALAGGTDGTDRDRTDMTYDSAVHLYTGSRATHNSGSKLDYIAMQDSIATIRRAFVFNTSGTPSGALPDQLDGFSFPSGASNIASDHRPVIMDLILPPATPCTGDGDCADGIACTIDACNLGTGLCSNTPDDGACDNGTYCDGAETCDAEQDCQPGQAVDCDDGVACTVDSCNEGAQTCDHLPDDGLCDNGLTCDGAEFCDDQNGCQAGQPVDCDDGVACTVDTCNEPAGACGNAPDDGACDNGTFCDGAEFCDEQNGCQNGTPPCPAPGEYCLEAGQQCVECLENAHCDDADPCNGTETCNPGHTCDPGTLTSDCNDNGREDNCDIADQTSQDTNQNGVPDECEAAPATSPTGLIAMTLAMAAAGAMIIGRRCAR